LCGLVIATTVMEFITGAKARSKATGERPMQALGRLVDRNKRRYGGFVVHLGVALIIIGVTGSSVFKREAIATLARGESFAVGRFTLRLEEMVSNDTPNHEFLGARLAVLEGGRRVGTLVPGQKFYKAGQDPSSEVDIRSTPREDLYLIMTGFDPQQGRVTVKAYLNPLLSWIWIGGGTLLLGSWLAMLPDLRERRRAAEARLGALHSYAVS
jgi:cytochrome c-type biogenesis protein CcmF